MVASRQPTIRALFTSPYAVDTTQTVLKGRGDVVTSRARHGRGLIEWEVDSTRWLGGGDSALVEVTAVFAFNSRDQLLARYRNAFQKDFFFADGSLGN